MRANSVIMIILAGAFGVLAVLLANMWLAGQRSALGQAEAHPRPPVETIVVAAKTMKFGDTLSAANLREIEWPMGALPSGAFRTRAEALGDGNRQALQAISENEPVLAARITGPGQRATLSAVLTEGMRAVSIRVNDVLGVAGFVLPGDRVDVMLTRTRENLDGEQQAFVDVLLQGVKVLAIDQVADESRDNPTVARAVTVEVGTRDAQKLTLAAGIGQLSLALRQVGAGEDETTGRIRLEDLTGEESDQTSGLMAEIGRLAAELDARKTASLLAPAETPAVAAEPDKPSRANVSVFRGVVQETLEVPRTE